MIRKYLHLFSFASFLDVCRCYTEKCWLFQLYSLVNSEISISALKKDKNIGVNDIKECSLVLSI